MTEPYRCWCGHDVQTIQFDEFTVTTCPKLQTGVWEFPTPETPQRCGPERPAWLGSDCTEAIG